MVDEGGNIPAGAQAPAGVTPEVDLVDELQHFATFLKTPRKEHKQRLDEALREERISPDRYQEGLKTLNEVQPSWRHRVAEKLPEIAADHTLFALILLTIGVSVEALLASALLRGASFVEVFFFCFPLTVATVLIGWFTIYQIGEEADIIMPFLGAGFILLVAGAIQTFLPGHEHLVFQAEWCSSNDLHSCGLYSWVAIIPVAYWRAFGPGVFITCILIGVLTGLATQYPAATRKGLGYVSRVRRLWQ
jgi:hypothetical protein